MSKVVRIDEWRRAAKEGVLVEFHPSRIQSQQIFIDNEGVRLPASGQ
jgi:hypothetical protein